MCSKSTIYVVFPLISPYIWGLPRGLKFWLLLASFHSFFFANLSLVGVFLYKDPQFSFNCGIGLKKNLKNSILKKRRNIFFSSKKILLTHPQYKVPQLTSIKNWHHSDNSINSEIVQVSLQNTFASVLDIGRPMLVTS